MDILGIRKLLLKKNNKTSKPKWAKKKNWKSVEFKSSAVKVKDQHILCWSFTLNFILQLQKFF